MSKSNKLFKFVTEISLLTSLSDQSLRKLIRFGVSHEDDYFGGRRFMFWLGGRDGGAAAASPDSRSATRDAVMCRPQASPSCLKLIITEQVVLITSIYWGKAGYVSVKGNIFIIIETNQMIY